MSKLFDDSESDSDTDLKTHNNYACNYNTWRQKEEFNKLRTKYGEEALKVEDSNSDSSSESEDDGEQITGEFEKDFFKTLSSLKNKDPSIYDKNIEFFKDDVYKRAVKAKIKEQPMYIKDYERKMVLENGGQLSENEDELDATKKSSTYVDEQKNLKKSLQSALMNVNENDDDNWGGMFKVREKTDEEHKNEENDYKKWLLGHKKDITDKQTESDLKSLKDYWSDPNLAEGEKFLRDYILNQRFLENDDENYIPTYEEVVHDSDQGLSEDEEAVEEQEEFEHKYNYRFEEPDQEFIKRYPRTVEHSLRRQDDRRKIKRVETKERKQKEKKQKMEEIKQMQALKQKEIDEKILKLKEITGNTDMHFMNEDIDGDFDPDSHDRRMQKLFNDEFYQGHEEEQKPEFPELEAELENWDNFDGEQQDETTGNVDAPHCEDEDFNMDCDYYPAGTRREAPENSRSKKRKRKSKFAQAISVSKPVFNPSDETYQEYLDEYYKLDCEDVIGDIPCRFKYRKVVPNSFGLSIEEILLAKDRELNRWCSLKKTVQYRPEHVEKYDVVAFDKKGKNEALKRKILNSMYIDGETSVPEESNTRSAQESTNLQSTVKQCKHKEMENASNMEENSSMEKIAVVNEMTAKQNKNEKKKFKKVAESDAVSAQQNKDESDMATKSPKEKNKNKMKHTTVSDRADVNSKGFVKAETIVKKEDDKTMQNYTHHKYENVRGQKRKASRHKNTDISLKKLKRGNKKKKFTVAENDSAKISDARLTAYGFKPKRFKNKIKYGQKNG